MVDSVFFRALNVRLLPLAEVHRSHNNGGVLVKDVAGCAQRGVQILRQRAVVHRVNGLVSVVVGPTATAGVVRPSHSG
jgi:hypothetical protein